MVIVNQKNPSKTVWKESSICTKTWNNSVLQFMKVSASEYDQDALTTDPDEIIELDDSEGLSGDEEDIFRNLLSGAGFYLTYGDNPSHPQVTLREKLLMDAGAIAGFLTGLCVYLDDPTKVKRLLLPINVSGSNVKNNNKNDESFPSLMNFLMGVKVLQQAIVDLLLDIMVEFCQPSEGALRDDSSSVSSKPFPDCGGATRPLESDGESEVTGSTQFCPYVRLDIGVGESIIFCLLYKAPISVGLTYVQSLLLDNLFVHRRHVLLVRLKPSLIDTRASIQAKWPEQSEELLGLIVNSLRALDGAVPQGCPEPRRRPQSAQKIALVLDKAPKHLQPDLVALVPRLVEHSEHHLAACALLERLQKPNAEPALRLPVFGGTKSVRV